MASRKKSAAAATVRYQNPAGPKILRVGGAMPRGRRWGWMVRLNTVPVDGDKSLHPARQKGNR